MPVDENGLPVETNIQKQAFAHWYGLGDLRTYKRVAAKFGKHWKTIQNWHDRFQWEDRRLKLLEERERVKGDVGPSIDPASVRCATRIEELISEILSDPETLVEIKSNIKKPTDLMNLAKLAAFLQGKNFDSGEDGESDGSLASRAALKILEEHGLGKGKDG